MDMTESKQPNSNTFLPPIVRVFAPENWGPVAKFRAFARTTYNFRGKSQDALDGVESHFSKYAILKALAVKLIPGLQEDVEQLKKYGYTPNLRSRELAAVVETLFCELYSSLDCMREVLLLVYQKPTGKPPQGIPTEKTSRLFSNAAEGKLDKDIPAKIINALSDAFSNWFPTLRSIRTEIAHFDVGDCGLNQNKQVFYLQPGIRISGKAYYIADVFGELSKFEKGVNELEGIVFAEMLLSLKDIPLQKTCCFSNYRIYQRKVSPSEAIDQHSGVCISYEWFEKDGMPICPFHETCGAYHRAKSTS